MSQSDFMAHISGGSRFTIRDIMDDFNVSMATARRWVSKPSVSQIPNVWPPTYTHVNHVSGIVSPTVAETPVGVIDTPQKLSRLESALLAAVPWSKKFAKDLQDEEFSKTLEKIYDKVIREPRDYEIEDMFSNASSEADIWDIVNKCWTILVLCNYQLDLYSKEKN